MESSALFSPLSNVELTFLTYGLVFVAILFGVLSIYLMVKLHTLKHSYNNMMRGAAGESIERLITSKIQEIDNLRHRSTALRAEIEKLATESQKHIQKVGVVRFNAFDDTGSDLSFAVTMLDATDSGFVLSGIYGREESRVYAKPVLKGESTYKLTKEEKQALDMACKK